MQREVANLAIGLAWLPDETLFSLVSRYHEVSGALHPWVTCARLFGHRLRGSAHDFPTRLDEFALRSGGEYGDGEQLALHHTLMRFYMPWRGAHESERILGLLRGDGIGSLKYSLGLLTSRFGASHPLKACAQCMAEDSERHGVTYWHRTHQWPGVWTCPRHGELLQVSRHKVDGQYRYSFVLPRSSELTAPWSEWRLSSQSRGTLEGRLQRLTALVLSATACEPGCFDDRAVLATAYRERLVEIGWLRHPNRLSWDVLSENFSKQTKWMISVPEFAALRVGSAAVRNQLSVVLYKRRARTHPLRHLLMMEVLFHDWTEFLIYHGRAVSTSQSQHERLTVERPNREEARHVDIEGSAREMARRNGVDIHTAMAWRAATGVRTQRRPKILKAPVLEKLVACLKEGVPKEEAAAVAGISISSVTRVMRTEPGLQHAWHQQRWLAAQARHRSVWTRLLKNYAGMALRLMRLLAPDSFAWLYRNDRDWLQSTSARDRAVPSGGNHVLAKWRERDTHLALEVNKAAIWLEERGQLKIGEIISAVPELAPLLRRIDRLPLTQQALVSIFGR
jgi:hypothetical protein